MKMHIRLGIIFSAIAMILTLAYGLLFYVYERNSFYDTAKENLTVLGDRMVQQFDEYVKVMDYTLENLIANTQFMDAMATHHYLQDTNQQNDPQLLAAKNTMANVLYRDPLNKNFYRVNAFSRNGMFYTSRFENRDTVNSLSYDIPGIVGGIEWLADADAQYLRRLLVPPYTDPWTVGSDVSVFSAVRSVSWMGRLIGYLEVQAKEAELHGIFAPQGLEGVEVCALINDGIVIYESAEGVSARAEAFLSAFHDDIGRNGELYELSCASNANPLVVYLSQSTGAWQASLFSFMYRILLFLVVVLAAALILIIFVSRRLTWSIRQLEQEMSGLQLNSLTLLPGEVDLQEKNEIRRLESAFHTLVDRLNASIQEEMRSRELHLKARMSALQAQINPHFIYNTLNVISSKSLEYQVLDIAQICDRFSDMLRYTTNMESKTVTLQEELRHVTNYLELLKARYEHRLQYALDFPDNTLQAMLPRLSLQPFVENAIVHGYRHNTRIMEIMLRGCIQADKLMLEIRDNGDGFSQDMLEALRDQSFLLHHDRFSAQRDDAGNGGVGMANTLSRLYYFSNGNMSYAAFNDDGAVIQITFTNEMERGRDV